MWSHGWRPGVPDAPLFLPFAAAAEEISVVAAEGPSPATTAASLTVLPLGPDLPPGEDLASVVDGASGTAVRRLGGLGDFAAVSLRGSTFRQVEVYLDGLPLNPDGASAVNLTELPVSAFERVDLYRGFAPVSYGSSAIGGVLDLVTPTKATPVTLSARGGSFGTFGTSGIVGPRFGGMDALLSFEQLHTSGEFPYFDDQGTEYTLFDDRTSIRTNNSIDRGSVLGRVRFGPRTARFTILNSFVAGQQELPGPISVIAKDARYDVARNLLSLGGELQPAQAWRVTPRAWWLWREETFDDRAGELGTGAQHTQDRTGTVAAQVTTTWTPAAWVTGTAVIRGRHESYTPYDLQAEQDDGQRARLAWSAAVGADVRMWDERITLSPAFQAEVLDDRFLGDVPWEHTAVTDTALHLWPSPRLGALVRPNYWLSLKGSVGVYVRPPDLTELFGDRGSMIGNPELVPETGEAWEVGVRAEAPWEGAVTGSFDAAFARRRAHDLIVWVQNSQHTLLPINVGEADIQSTEGALTLGVAGWVQSQSNVTWTVTGNRSTEAAYAGKELPNVPDLEVSQVTTLRWPGHGAIAHTWSYTGLTFTDTANIGFTAPRDLHSFSLEIAPVPGMPVVRAELLNAFDVRGTAVDRNPLDPGDDTAVVRPLTDFSGYPLPGRTVMVSLSWTEPRKDP